MSGDPIETVIAGLSRNNPGKTFAGSDKRDAVGVWDAEAGRFWTVYALTIFGSWERCRTELHVRTSDYDGPAFTYKSARENVSGKEKRCAEVK